MSGMTDGQQLRNAQWGKVSRLFKPAMIISAALTQAQKRSIAQGRTREPSSRRAALMFEPGCMWH
ncbi:hypothetical protein [Stenotrophomonas maltophilia]|uniref:hypothetical protein n=1 Tax=Stenotrophomonas maltophilia TaxID=40324 RepID=UPI001F52C89F|nr:hypothetical protein [Stenotrophomonas maltophilia]